MASYEAYIVARQDWSVKLVDSFVSSLRKIIEEGTGRLVKSLVAADSSQNAFKMRGKIRSRRIFMQFACTPEIQKEVSRLISLKKKEGDVLGYNLQRCEEFVAFSFPSSERRSITTEESRVGTLPNELESGDSEKITSDPKEAGEADSADTYPTTA